MRSKTKLVLMLLALPAIVFYACKKYKDPPVTTLDPRLTNHYCNDPRAVNYNWNFPGIDDSTTCVFPVDSFIGTWIFHDTIYLPSGDTQGTTIKQLIITSTEDTAKTHLAVAGWCGGNTPFNATANKYNRADVDTFPGGPFGQFLCSQSDTLNGYFSKNPLDTLTYSLKVDFTINSASGVTYHRGIATKM